MNIVYDGFHDGAKRNSDYFRWEISHKMKTKKSIKTTWNCERLSSYALLDDEEFIFWSCMRSSFD